MNSRGVNICKSVSHCAIRSDVLCCSFLVSFLSPVHGIDWVLMGSKATLIRGSSSRKWTRANALRLFAVSVGQPDGVTVAQKEETPEAMDTVPDEVAPQVNGEKDEKESPDVNDISEVEEKAAEEKPDDTTEVGFKKIFRFVGFKFTLKKDKSEEKDPVKLLTVKDKEDEEEPAATIEEKSTGEEKEVDPEAPSTEAEVLKDAETTEDNAANSTEEEAKEEVAEKEGESSPPSQEITLSPFRKLFSGGLFSNLRKKASIKKTKEEEDKEVAVEEETTKTEEDTAAVEEKEEKVEEEQETKEEAAATPEENKPGPEEETPATAEEAESEPSSEEHAETVAPAEDELKQEEEKAEAEVEATSEAELLSSQEKVKLQGSPLKKLFTGAGLKKLSTKKQRSKKDAESKVTESGEQTAEQLQSSTESTEAPKADSGPSSPEESGEHVVDAEADQAESGPETDGEVASDGEKKKEGIIAWSSFKKLVTPKRRVKRSSESEDEATGEKPAKSATLSSSESAPLADKSVEEDSKEEKPSEEDADKLVSSTEEPKKKMDTSVSWEALMCMGGPKKRTRKTSDSDDEETKADEEGQAAAVEGEQESKTDAAAPHTQSTESEGEAVSSEPASVPAERESAWDTLKRMVLSKNKVKGEEKAEEGAEQVQSDSEAPKDESSFSLRKLFPGRKKKKAEKQTSTEQGSGEEDSDTPAVVPLSEYEQLPQAQEEKPAERPPEVTAPTNAPVEDRSPSWIPANVEDSDKHDQLSDIPEEAENATPKSVDTDVTEDETEDHPTTVAGRRLSTAEVKPLAELPPAETTPVSQEPESESAEELVQAIDAQISEIPCETSVAVEDAPITQAGEKTEAEPTRETAESNTNTVLQLHTDDEAMAICTGLGTTDIAELAPEKPPVAVMEPVAEVQDALSAERSVENAVEKTEEATLAEDVVLRAESQQVETVEIEPRLDCLPGEVAETASVSYEPAIESSGIISTSMEVSEIVQASPMNENSPKVALVDPITPTAEAAVCSHSVQVSEPTVQAKEVTMDLEKLDATEENSAVKETIQVVTEEVSSTVAGTAQTSVPESAVETVAPSEGACVITETVVLVTSAGVETVEDSKEDREIEAQSAAIAQSVIQDAMEEVSTDTAESEKPSTPADPLSTPVQAVATTEKEMESSTEKPVVTDTPVALDCKKPDKLLHVAMEVCDTIPLEVAENLDASVEEEKEDDGTKKAVEVDGSEEVVTEREVTEINGETEACKEVQDDQNKEGREEVRPESEEKQEKVLDIHMPVQVVLQSAQVVEDPSVVEDVAVEFDSNGPMDVPASTQDASTKAAGEDVPESVSTHSEEPQAQVSAEKTPSGKCAEVMAQVMEVIEEAVKEIEPVSTEVTPAS